MTEPEKETYVKIQGQKYAYKAININKSNGWIEFDRVNTKTQEVAGHLEFPLTNVESIETR